MKSQSQVLSYIEQNIKEFINRSPVEESSLTLDGMGPNSAYQYAVLNMLGFNRILALKHVHLISAGFFPYLYFYAIKTNLAKKLSNELKSWDKNNRQAHQCGFTSLLKRFPSFATGQSPLFSTDGFELAFRDIVDDSLLNSQIKILPPNVRLYLYNQTDRRIEVLSAQDPAWNEMPIRILCRALPSIPRIFEPVKFNEKILSDPVYSPLRSQMYRAIKNSSSNYLISNLYKQKSEKDSIYLKPHPYANGRWLLYKDLAKFIFNLPNKEVYDAIDSGLNKTVTIG